MGWRFAWCVAVGALALLIVRVVWHDGTWALLLVNSYRPLTFGVAVPVAAVAIIRRRHRLAAAAAVPAGWALLTLTALIPGTPTAEAPTFRLVTANLLMVHDDPASLLDEIETFDADVLVFQEVSGRWADEFAARGYSDRYPTAFVHAQEDSFGSALFSRFAFEDLDFLEVDGLVWPRAVLRVGEHRVEVLNVHTLPPRTANYAERHRAELDELATWSERDGAVILAGDFNSTGWSRFAADVAGRYDDAWEVAGSGWGNTWPNGLFSLPPARLDHVYVTEAVTVHAAQLGRGEGSDHRPLIVDLAFRATSEASRRRTP